MTTSTDDAKSSDLIYYIRSGALMRCNQGTAPCQLFIPPRSVTIGDEPWAHENDRDPVVNKLNFGVCNVTQKPCPATIRCLRWRDVKRDVYIGEARALLDYSTLPCAVGGTISFVHSGQQLA